MGKKALQAGERNTKPSGAVFHQVRRPPVSEEFIKSLASDGISEVTIKSIERDNARDTDKDNGSSERR